MGWNVARNGISGNEFYFGGPLAISSITLALNSAYTYNSAGDAYAPRMQFADDGALDAIWLYIDSYTGNWANTDELLNLELREVDTTVFKPGTLVTNGAKTLDLTGAPTGWQKFTIAATKPNIVQGRPYAIVIGDADGGASDFVTIGVRAGHSDGYSSSSVTTTTDGFSSVNSNSANSPTICVEVAGLFYGDALRSLTTRASSSLRYGNTYKFPSDVEIIGAIQSIDNFLDNGVFEIFLASQAPADTPQRVFGALHANLVNARIGAALFDIGEVFTMLKDVEYYFVLNKDTALTVPREGSIGTGTDASLETLLPLAGDCHEVAEVSGSPNTFVETASKIAMLGLIGSPVNPAGGGGGLVMPRNPNTLTRM